MKISTFFKAATVILFAGMTAAVAVPNLNNPVEDHLPVKRGGMVVTGSLYPGGPEVNLTGTIDQIFPKLKQVYPELEPVFEPTTLSTPDTPSVVKRAPAAKPTCFSGNPADRYVIYNHALPYLRAIKSFTCSLPSGGGCTNVYCAPAPAANIRVCNPWFVTRRIPCSAILDVAEVIVKDCVDGPQKGIRGQINAVYNGIRFQVAIGTTVCLDSGSPLFGG
ncbi:hypothetical protein TWF506_006266 [Arthrobotrys conoides]|uniref:Uncharacterized protein n=1 Tax=Arthrobotrys conoides TaxID=74498 RepID=A0AAN8NT67_9PEZI